ncbi:MAG: DUF481 domain-containing protein [Gemmatimonadales bacterium]|nr:DUF481 domain-containing protein [Gemmatimonadales bacterium]
MRFRVAGYGAALLAISSAPRLHAQDQVKTLQFVGDLGFVNASGNSEVTSFNLGDKLVAQTGDKRHLFTQLFGFIYGRTDGETTANSWRASGRYEYGVSKRFYLYAQAGAERNRFAGIARRFEEGPGVVVKAVAAPKDEFDLEGGVSLVQQRATDGTEDNFAAGRVAALYKHKFTDKTYLAQTIEFLPNLEVSKDYRINSETSLVAPISGNVAVKAAYVIRFDNTPLVTDTKTFKKSDRILTTGIQITY